MLRVHTSLDTISNAMKFLVFGAILAVSVGLSLASDSTVSTCFFALEQLFNCKDLFSTKVSYPLSNFELWAVVERQRRSRRSEFDDAGRGTIFSFYEWRILKEVPH